MTDIELRADCSRCAALCCVALAFDKGESFDIDKAADVPCPNLGARGFCTIHDKLKDFGFAGCARYDCNGAGQRVTQELFGGRSWQEDPKLLAPMSAALRVMARVHGAIVLVREATKLRLEPADHERLETFARVLEPKEGWTRESLVTFDRGETIRDLKVFLSSLKRYVEG
jgi:hypothetical protein